MDWIAVALVVLAASAAAFDLGTRRIPNYLTVTGLAAALLLRAAGGGEMLLAGLGGAALALGLSFPLFAAGGLGGGDVKLLVAVGAFLGPGRLMIALLATALVGGVMAFGAALRRRAVGATFRGVGLVVRGAAMRLFLPGRPHTMPSLSTPGAIAVPYGVAIAAGAVAGLFL